jgi:beta/gamma crystallin
MEIDAMKRMLLSLALLVAAGTTYAAELTLFGQPNFNGRRLRANDAVVNLANSGFNDRAQSVVVREGVWQLCDDAYFRGRCVTLEPGRYASLREIGLDKRISSAREVSDWGPPPGPGRDGQGDRWGGGVRAILYSNPDFRGDRFVVDENVMPNLANSGFNDRAQSLRVERGYWIFCSDANFQGQCRTFGPGNYPNLPHALENRISSGRRISRDYPYNASANWGQ